MTEDNPFAAPKVRSAPASEPNELQFEYLGFWKRVLASIVDNIITGIVFVPVTFLLLSVIKDKDAAELTDSGLKTIIPAIAIILLWTYFGATPGKMVFGAKVVDARTFRNPSLGKSILRYIGYIPSILLLFSGFIMVAFDKKKRGLHDLMAGTLVVVPKQRYTRRSDRPIPSKDSVDQA